MKHQKMTSKKLRTVVIFQKLLPHIPIRKIRIPNQMRMPYPRQKKTAPETELPAIHIGQIPEDGTLPAADDDTFSYDLPVSFASAEALILFVNYDIEKRPHTKRPAHWNGAFSAVKAEQSQEAQTFLA